MRFARIERIGPYRMIDVIAQGATSVVLGGIYEGPAGFSAPVAIKTLRTDALRSPVRVRDFVHEARAAAHVVHPNIAQIHALLDEPGLPLLVMERVRGWSVRALIATAALRGRPIPHERVVELVGAAALAAHALHEAGLIHGHLTPDNLLVTTTGYVKVIDFGAARWDGDRAADVYALGALLRELCAGPPSSALRAVIARALRGHPGEQFATTADLAQALDDIAADHGWRASPPATARLLARTFGVREPTEDAVAAR